LRPDLLTRQSMMPPRRDSNPAVASASAAPSLRDRRRRYPARVIRPPLKARVRYRLLRVIHRLESWAAALGVRAARLVLRVGALVLVAVAVWLFVVQPLPEPMAQDALIGVAGIVATVLSLGLTVTLIVAQHTAEKHARVLYVEFRRERAWLLVLGLLAIGVVAIVAAALGRPSISTGWASLAVAASLGVYTASLLPRMLDSLDATILAERLTARTVRELHAIANGREPHELESALKPVARRGLEIASGMAVQGITSNDKEVVRAGFAGIRRILVAYVEGSPTRGWDTEIINLAFQHLGEDVDRCMKASPVLIMPAVIEELSALGVEAQRTLEEDGPEAVSGRLNSLFLDVVTGTLLNEDSAGAAMAAQGIGESALALIRAKSPNMVADHIRRLRSIALLSLRAEQDHVAGRAHVDLSRIAIALAGMDTQDIMPPTLFHDACSALGDSVDAFVGRTSTKGGLAGDLAWMWTTQPWAEANLAWVVMSGVYADVRSREHRRGDFGLGATAITHSLVKLATEGTSGFSTASNAIETASMGVRGSLGIQVDADTADVVSDLWITVVRRLIDPTKETLHEVETLAELLLAGVYDVESTRPTPTRMRDGLTDALTLTKAITDDFHRRRRARAWLGAGRAALGCGDNALAQMIATAIAPDLRELRAALRERPWAADSDGLLNAVRTGARAMRLPDLPDTHTRPEVVAAFDALLDKKPRRRRRPPPTREAPSNGLRKNAGPI
jgi:hypothetical protein